MRGLRRTTLMILLLALVASVASAYEAGTTGLLFLRLGVGERAAGMGEAYTALADDATAVYWNPAGLDRAERTGMHLMHNEWMLSLRQEYIGLVHPTQAGTFGLAVTALTMDELERREEVPTSEPLGHFSAFDMAFHLAWARGWGERLDLGIGAKWIYSRLDEESAKGFLFDFGLGYETRIPGLRVAGVVLNVGPQFKYRNESFDAPLTMKLGAALMLPFHPGQSDFTLAHDLLLVGDGDIASDDSLGEAAAMSARHHFGAEWDWRGQAALRLGYKAGYDSQGLTAGAGITWQGYRFDYAFLDVGNDLGNAHRFGVGMEF